MAAIAAFLVRPDVRLVSLTGPGGVGKTRLALAVASEIATAFRDGSTYVDLAPVADPALVVQAIAQVLGIRETGDETLGEALHRYLRDREQLLLLDNFEHVLTAGTALASLLSACPELKMLVTSRTVLRLSGEHTYPVPPLALPEQPGLDKPLSVAAAAESAAVKLFVARATAAKPDFALDEANAAAVVEICRRLDGLPLAIELATAKLAVFPPSALLRRLERRLPTLAGGPRDLPSRQQTMRSAIAWSYDLLTPAEQRLFRRLALFGDFSLEAAEAVATPMTAAGLNPADLQTTTADGVMSLTQQSLLQPREDSRGEPRYQMLEIIREYGLDQLATSGEDDDARRVHARYFLSLVERSTNDAEADEYQLDIEHDNLRAALGWASEHDPETALALANGLWRFWDRRGRWTEGRTWLERALASSEHASPGTRAAALAGLATLAIHQADFNRARRCLEESRSIWAELGDQPGVARALRGLGIIASEQNELDRARALFEEALVLVRALGRQREITHLLGDLGLVAHRHGDNEAAVKYLEEALTGHDSVDEWTMTVMRGNLGLAYWGLGDQARAAALFEDALVASRRLGDRYGEAINQFNLANYALRRNRLSEAATRYRESIAGANELGGVRLVNRALDGLAAVVAARRVPELAAQLFGAATALREATGDVLDATEEAERAPIVATIREQLGEQAWAKASSAGETLTLEAAIAEADAVMEPLRGAGERGAQMADALLTTREAEVLRLLVEGRSDREIADALFITRATASKHVSNILAKLEVDSRAAAAAQAVRDRLI